MVQGKGKGKQRSANAQAPSSAVQQAYSLNVGRKPKLRGSFIPPKITPARQPGCQRHAMGHPLAVPRAPRAPQHSHTQHPIGHVAIMAMGLSSPLTSKLNSRGKPHYTPARPTHTACSHKIMISWTSTTARRRCVASAVVAAGSFYFAYLL